MLYTSPDNEYPRHIGDIQLVSKGFKEGDTLPEGWAKVAEVERPDAGADKITVEEYPKVISNVLSQNWVIRDMTQAELDRRNAPASAKAKLIELGLTEAEVFALTIGLVR